MIGHFTYTIDIPDFTLPLTRHHRQLSGRCAGSPTPPAVNDFCGNPITPVLTTTPTDDPL